MNNMFRYSNASTINPFRCSIYFMRRQENASKWTLFRFLDTEALFSHRIRTSFFNLLMLFYLIRFCFCALRKLEIQLRIHYGKIGAFPASFPKSSREQTMQCAYFSICFFSLFLFHNWLLQNRITKQNMF